MLGVPQLALDRRYIETELRGGISVGLQKYLKDTACARPRIPPKAARMPRIEVGESRFAFGDLDHHRCVLEIRPHLLLHTPVRVGICRCGESQARKNGCRHCNACRMLHYVDPCTVFEEGFLSSARSLDAGTRDFFHTLPVCDKGVKPEQKYKCEDRHNDCFHEYSIRYGIMLGVVRIKVEWRLIS